jgi:uncharacterized MAPEG superfamily protein
MTTDLWCLVWTAVLSVAVPNVYFVGRMQVAGGMEWMLGNRDTPLEAPPWVGRAQRAHANLVENLAPFAALVLSAAVAGRANGWTALGAELFLVARIAHFAIYTAGLPGLRTLAFLAGVAGEVLILVQLF